MTDESEKGRSVIQFRVDAADKAAFVEAAKRDGHVSLTAWMIYTLRKAAKPETKPKK